MSRTIKFRAWHKKEKRMFEVCYLSWFSGIFLVGDKDAFDEQRYGSGEVVMMQFTGLHDQNGKEIYEGDIVAGGTTPEHVKGIVRIGKTDATFTIDDYGARVPYMGVYLDGLFDMEEELTEKKLLIVGNIYQNPDLMTSHEAK